MQSPGKEGRHYEPEGIHQMDAEEHGGNRGEWLGPARDLARQEQDKWQGEVHHHEYYGYPVPSAIGTVEIPAVLLRKVTRPDDEKLRKSNVGPEHHKGQQQIAQVVKHL